MLGLSVAPAVADYAAFGRGVPLRGRFTEDFLGFTFASMPGFVSLLVYWLLFCGVE